MNVKLRSALITLVVILAASAFTACEGTLSVSVIVKPDPKGKVLNVKTGTGLAGASVTMSYISGAADKDKPGTPYTATTNTSGEYSFTDVIPGEYQLTATKTGYGFTKEIVNVTGEAFTLPDIGGFQPGAQDVLTIFVLWDKAYKDVDAHLTAPSKDLTDAGTPSSTTGAPTFTQTASLADFYTYNNAGVTDPGFYPDTATSRLHVYWDNKNASVSAASPSSIELDIDNRGTATQNPGGPETVTIRYFPFTDYATTTSYTSSGSGDPSALAAGTYTWSGVMEYYLQAWSKTSSTQNTYDSASLLSEEGSSSSADAVVYVFNGTSQIGVYRVPTFTNLKTVSVLKINMLYNQSGKEVFQILPDLRVMSQIRGMEGNGIVAVEGWKVR